MSALSKPHPRHVRRLLVERWNQLFDDLLRLEVDLQNAPAEAFTEDERRRAENDLHCAGDHLLNGRPLLPRSRPRPPGRRRGN